MATCPKDNQRRHRRATVGAETRPECYSSTRTVGSCCCAYWIPRDNKPALWVTPGGGVEPGEEIAVAAVRELEEETGLRLSISELGEPVAVCRGDWEFRGIPLYGEDWFFTQHVDTFVPSDSGWDEIEREIHQGWRWWAPDELDDADEPVLPAELADLIRSLHAGVAVGGEPRQLPWKTV